MALSLEKAHKKLKKKEAPAAIPSPSVRPWQTATNLPKPPSTEEKTSLHEAEWSFAPLTMNREELREQLDLLAEYGRKRLAGVKKSIKKLVRSGS